MREVGWLFVKVVVNSDGKKNRYEMERERVGNLNFVLVFFLVLVIF